ncbi:M48 family metalloprotease [Jiella mangrovi]|uniref:M48 family metallopeptidase n=1 Tax=Jiella mangrovi TaxID=2821407 RepID=A0ABS4BKP1_9HYPH|nr:M48 family metalloprotease [Jiella mangrovi]MBP0617107.1 M48 family metallopeptidase [Jiella mangrovi]
MRRFLSSLFGRFASVTVAASLACTGLGAPSTASAEARAKRNLPIVRDAEIEALVVDYVRPLLKAAGLSRAGIETVLVNSRDFNAFVLGRRIFVNTGAIALTETPNQLIGILAHEIGHLAGGHQQRLRQRLEGAQVMVIAAALLGAGVAIGGAAAGARGSVGAGAGLFSAGGSAAQRSILTYLRGEESVADRSAINYLAKTGQSARGLVETFQILEQGSLFDGSRGRSYLSSHPLPRDRIFAIEEAAKRSTPYARKDPPALAERHDLARAKIAAYAGGMSDVRRLFAKDPRSLAALYGDAIATFLAGSTAMALKKMDGLIAARPSNPWFHEMRGEILLDAGRGKEAVAAFSRAAKLDRSNSGLLRAEIGQALVVSGGTANLKQAIEMIQAGLQSDPMNGQAYRYLAMAYGQLGEIGRAELATAEGHWSTGSLTQAKVFAARAQAKLKPGSPPWRRAQDILAVKSR